MFRRNIQYAYLGRKNEAPVIGHIVSGRTQSVPVECRADKVTVAIDVAQNAAMPSGYEVFIDGGRVVMTNLVFPNEPYDPYDQRQYGPMQ